MSSESMDLNQILNDFENDFEGKKHLYIPHENSDSLIVCMSTHNFRDRYFYLKSMLIDKKCNLLFITDINNSYYLDDDLGEGYNRLLYRYISKFNPENITLFGSSMSGYGALYHSIKLKTNALVCNPQIAYKETFDNAWGDLRNTLKKVNGFQDIDNLIMNQELDSVWHISHGDYLMDVVNINKLKSSSPKKSRIFYQKLIDSEHGFYFKNTNDVYSIHRLLCELRKINLSKL